MDEADHHQPRERRDGLRQDVQALRTRLEEHINNESTVLTQLAESIRELGAPVEIRERRVFIDAWIKREEQRATLRRAIIEKTLVGALLAVVGFVAVAVGNEVISIIRDNISRPRS